MLHSPLALTAVVGGAVLAAANAAVFISFASARRERDALRVDCGYFRDQCDHMHRIVAETAARAIEIDRTTRDRPSLFTATLDRGAIGDGFLQFAKTAEREQI